MNLDNPPIRFTRDGLVRGYVKTLPIAVGVAVFGMAYGLLAGQHGLSLAETGLMSALATLEGCTTCDASVAVFSAAQTPRVFSGCSAATVALSCPWYKSPPLTS